MTKLRHYDKLGTARFITFSCHNRLKLLTNDLIIERFLRHLESGRLKHGFKLYAYVIMPSHVHLVLLPTDDMRIGSVIGEIKSLSAREMLPLLGKLGIYDIELLRARRDNVLRFAFWQRRCYDHNCRTMDIVLEKIRYCHNNPVRAGLVDDPSEWKWSSCSFYTGQHDTVIEIDSLI